MQPDPLLDHRSETLLAVSKTGSLTAAAKLLFVTQPAVSQQLNAWEKELGFKLLDHQGKKLVKVDRFFPSSKRCCKCGNVRKELQLSERVYRCNCGNIMDRDKNAAINIREEARRILIA